LQLKSLEPSASLEITDDLLKQNPVITNFFKIIDENISPPFSISVNGCWGSGKTTFLLLLKKTLEKQGYKTIWFNPWEYERTENILLAFMQNLVKEFINLKFDIKDLGIFSLTLFTAGVNLAAQFLTGGKLSYKDVKEIYNDVDEAIKKEFENYKTYEDITSDIKNDFSKITQKIYDKHKKPLIIFFDDLDRCLPERALELLEAIKNLFVVEGARVIFISGIDTDVVKQFIKQKYQTLKGNFAINYFKKIFNLTVSVPKFEFKNFHNYIKNYIVELFKDKDFDRIKESNPELVDILSKKIIDLSVLAGVNSYRNIFNIINNLFIIYKFSNNDQKIWEDLISEKKIPGQNDKKEKYFLFDIILYILFIKENWNDFYENTIIEARKNKKITFGELANIKHLHEEFMNTDANLQNFIHVARDNSQNFQLGRILEEYFMIQNPYS